VHKDLTFHGHETVGAKLADKQLRELRLSNDDRERIVNLIRHHLFRIDCETWESRCAGCGNVWRSNYSKYVEKRPSYLPAKDICPKCRDSAAEWNKICSESSLGTVRRIVRRVGGEEGFNDLLLLRTADRSGNKRKRGQTFHFWLVQQMYKAAKEDDAAFKITDLEISGEDLKVMGHQPGPLFGEILWALLEIVLEDPSLNKKETLKGIVEERWQIES